MQQSVSSVTKFLGLLLASSLMMSSTVFSVYAADVIINSGTLVYFKVKEAFDSDNYPRKDAGTVDFVVSRDVKIGQEVVIAKGTPAEATLLKNKNNFIYGIAGKAQFGSFKTVTVDGKPVDFRDGLTIESDDRILPAFIISGWIKGQDAKLGVEQEFSISTNTPIVVKTNSAVSE